MGQTTEPRTPDDYKHLLPETPSTLSGVWVAFYSDRSGFAVFATEIEALRHAVENSMQVKFVEWGTVDV